MKKLDYIQFVKSLTSRTSNYCLIELFPTYFFPSSFELQDHLAAVFYIEATVSYTLLIKTVQRWLQRLFKFFQENLIVIK